VDEFAQNKYVYKLSSNDNLICSYLVYVGAPKPSLQSCK